MTKTSVQLQNPFNEIGRRICSFFWQVKTLVAGDRPLANSNPEKAPSQLKRNMGAGSAMALLGSLLSVISYPLYLHFLGYHRYGLWLALSVVVSIAQLGNLGIPWALTKLVAEDHSLGDWEGIKTYINTGCLLILSIGFLFIALIMSMREEILKWFKLEGADAAVANTLLPYVAVLSVLVLVFSTMNAILGGLGRMDLTSYNEALIQMMIIVFSAALLYFRMDVSGMLAGTIAAYLAGQVLVLFHVHRLMPVSILSRTTFDLRRTGRILHIGGWLLVTTICSLLLTPITRLILSRYLGLSAITINDMCFTGSMRVRGVFDSAFRPVTPDISNRTKGERVELENRIHRVRQHTSRIILFVALPLFVLLMIGINPLLHVWLHRSFDPALPSTFRIALLAAFISLVGSPAYYILIGAGRPRDVAFATAIQTGANALMLILLARYHLLTVQTAAAAFAIAAFATTVYLRAMIPATLKSARTP